MKHARRWSAIELIKPVFDCLRSGICAKDPNNQLDGQVIHSVTGEGQACYQIWRNQ